MANVNWRSIWMTLFMVQYAKLPATEAIPRLIAAGLSRLDALRHYHSTLDNGYVMGRELPR